MRGAACLPRMTPDGQDASIPTGIENNPLARIKTVEENYSLTPHTWLLRCLLSVGQFVQPRPNLITIFFVFQDIH